MQKLKVAKGAENKREWILMFKKAFSRRACAVDEHTDPNILWVS